MRSLFLSAVLLGLAVARNTLVKIKADGDIFKIPNVFGLSGSYNVDSGYGTAFDSKPDSSDTDIYYESYGIYLNCFLEWDLKLELFGFYYYQTAVKMTVFDITPYRQKIAWIRPVSVLLGNKNAFDVQFSGESEIHFLEIIEATEQNAKVLSKSLIDYITDVWTNGINQFY